MAATFSYPPSAFHLRGCSMKENHEQLKQQLNSSIRINGTFRSPIKVESLSQTFEAAATTLNKSVTSVENGRHQDISTKKQLVDPHHQGLIVKGEVGCRHTVVIRFYEVGPNKTRTLESILNLCQGGLVREKLWDLLMNELHVIMEKGFLIATWREQSIKGMRSSESCLYPAR